MIPIAFTIRQPRRLDDTGHDSQRQYVGDFGQSLHRGSDPGSVHGLGVTPTPTGPRHLSGTSVGWTVQTFIAGPPALRARRRWPGCGPLPR